MRETQVKWADGRKKERSSWKIIEKEIRMKRNNLIMYDGVQFADETQEKLKSDPKRENKTERRMNGRRTQSNPLRRQQHINFE